MAGYQEPILITGCARSGTSITAGIVDICGAWGGDLRPANRYNAKGMFENATIVNEYVKPLLKRLGVDTMGQNPLPDIEAVKVLAQNPTEVKRWRASILRVIYSQHYSGGPWYYKGAKMCLIWPLWHKAFPGAKWIVVRRSPEDVIASCMKTTFMRGYKTWAGWLGWVADHEKRFEEMHNAGLKVFEIWPQRAINGDLTEVQMVINNLALKWDLDKVREFISPSLWHRNKQTDRRS